jgi:1-acyl-sn-glycerol-3-phosphate acyltransferase
VSGLPVARGAAHRARSALAWASGIAVFACMVILLGLLGGLFPPRRWDGLAKRLSRALVRCFRMRVVVEGVENLEAVEACILVSNHVNLLDGFLLYGLIPRFFRGLEQRQHFSWPVWGWFSRRFGNIALDQSGGGRTASALRQAGRALASGISILVFPEGHRTRDGEIGPFARGAFRLAERNGAVLVPLVHAGSWEVFRKGGGGVVPGRVVLSILPPWGPERYRDLGIEEFKESVKAEMVAAYSRNRP